MRKILNSIIISTICFCQCEILQNSITDDAISFGKGNSEIIKEINSMKNAKGIIPFELSAYCSGFLTKYSKDHNEFFVYNKDRAIIILSVNPMYFTIINSGDFYFHLENELTQLINNISPENKKASSIPSSHKIGKYEVSLFFIPNELRFSTEGKISDINYENFSDPYLLYNAARKTVLYTPILMEEKIYSDLIQNKNLGKEIIIHTKKTLFSEYYSNNIIAYYTSPQLLPDFSFIYGENLSLTEELIGKNNRYYTDIRAVTADYIYLFSTPLGNSQFQPDAYLSKTSFGKNGIALLIRGDLSSIEKFLSEENIDFNPTAPLPLSIILKDRYDNNLYVNISEERHIRLKVYKNNSIIYETPTFNSIEYILTGLPRGQHYMIEAIDDSSSTVLAKSSIYYTDIIVTEIVYWGSSFNSETFGANDDDWIEIKNISTQPVNINSLDAILYNTKMSEAFWFGPSNTGTDSHSAIDCLLNPGDYAVIASRDNKFFIKDNINRPANFFKKGTVTKNKIGQNYVLEIKRNNNVIQKIQIKDFGKKAPYKSMVLNKNSEWSTSENDSLVPATNDEKSKNFCSPGYSTGNEF